MGIAEGKTITNRQIDDFTMYSLPQILHTEDRMSMAESSEVRAPFLDYRLVEKLIPMKIENKISNGWTKYLLRLAMKPFMPSEITWRKDKQNFGNSQGELLKGKLKNEIMNDYFSKKSLIFETEIFDRKNLINVYNKYSKQSVNTGHIAYKEIFSSISLEIWLRKYINYIK